MPKCCAGMLDSLDSYQDDVVSSITKFKKNIKISGRDHKKELSTLYRSVMDGLYKLFDFVKGSSVPYHKNINEFFKYSLPQDYQNWEVGMLRESNQGQQGFNNQGNNLTAVIDRLTLENAKIKASYESKLKNFRYHSNEVQNLKIQLKEKDWQIELKDQEIIELGMKIKQPNTEVQILENQQRKKDKNIREIREELEQIKEKKKKIEEEMEEIKEKKEKIEKIEEELEQIRQKVTKIQQ